MKIWFGPQKGKAVNELTDADLTSLSGWITGLLESPTAPSGDRARQFRRLLLQINRELGIREGDEAPTLDPDAPVTLLQSLTPAQAKVAFTIFLLGIQAKGQPFRASYESLMADGNLGSEHAVSEARRLLLSLGLIKSTSRGEIVFGCDNPADIADCCHHFSSTLLSVKDSKPDERGHSSLHSMQETVKDAVAALGIKMDEHTRRMARDKLAVLLRSGTYTPEDAIAVAKWARRTYNSGEDRWTLILDLVYLWTLPRFAAFLGAAKSPVSAKDINAIIDPDGEMVEELRQKALKRGLR